MNMIIHYAGMDIHASNIVIQTITPNGLQIQQWEIPTQADHLIGWARSYSHGSLQVILEYGAQAYWVASALAPWVDRLVYEMAYEVDTAGLVGKKTLLPGEILAACRAIKSAEAIVLCPDDSGRRKG